MAVIESVRLHRTVADQVLQHLAIQELHDDEALGFVLASVVAKSKSPQTVADGLCVISPKGTRRNPDGAGARAARQRIETAS